MTALSDLQDSVEQNKDSVLKKFNNLQDSVRQKLIIILCRIVSNKKFKFVQDSVRQNDNFMQDSVRQKNLNLCRTASNKKFKFVQDSVQQKIKVCAINFCGTISYIEY